MTEKSQIFFKSIFGPKQITAILKLTTYFPYVHARVHNPNQMRHRIQRSADDARNLRDTIAAVEPRPVSQLVAEHESRLGARVKWVQDCT